jgi:hypothetical protein
MPFFAISVSFGWPMLNQLFPIIILSILAYPFFWVQSFDAMLGMKVISEHDPGVESELVLDDPPSFFAIGALGWTLCLGALVGFGKGTCSLYASNALSSAAVLGLMTVAVCGKSIFGPVASCHKRMLLTRNNELVYPFSYRIFDIITAYPGNLLTSVATKLIAFFAFWVLLKVIAIAKIEDRNTTLVLPLYVILPWSLMFFGRV